MLLFRRTPAAILLRSVCRLQSLNYRLYDTIVREHLMVQRNAKCLVVGTFQHRAGRRNHN